MVCADALAGNWGTQTNVKYSGPKRYCGTRPNGKGGPCPGPDGANAYLRDELSSALLKHGWSVGGGLFESEKHDWVGTTDMDTIEPCFEDLIVEQCARHLTQLKSFEGIAIDRLDYSEFLCVAPYPTSTAVLCSLSRSCSLSHSTRSIDQKLPNRLSSRQGLTQAAVQQP